MGHLIYGVAPAIEIEDWTLQHLRAVIVTKLRRDESFVFTWENESAIHGDDAIEKSGRYGSVWISKASPLYFSFDGPLKDPLNLRWLQQLADAAQSSTGLRPLEEPSGEGAPHPTDDDLNK